MIPVVNKTFETKVRRGDSFRFTFNVYEYRRAIRSVGILARRSIIDWHDAAAITQTILSKVDEVFERNDELCQTSN